MNKQTALETLPPNNTAIQALMPYRKHGLWVFDDERFGLVAELFVKSMSDIIDDIVVAAGLDLDEAADGFRLTFSQFEFPNSTHSFEWVRGELSGNTYLCHQTESEGWLCPALLLYFTNPPERMYASAAAL